MAPMALTHFSVLSPVINTRKSRNVLKKGEEARLATRQVEKGESGEFKAHLEYLS